MAENVIFQGKRRPFWILVRRTFFLAPRPKKRSFHVEIGQMEYKKTVAKIKQKITHLYPTPISINKYVVTVVAPVSKFGRG